MHALLLQLAAEQLPAVIAGVKALFAKRSPDEPQPTDAEVMAASVDTPKLWPQS